MKNLEIYLYIITQLFLSALDTSHMKSEEQKSSMKQPTLLEVCQERMRVRHLSRYTERQYLGWIQRYLRFHNKKHPREVGTTGIVSFLTHIAVKNNVASSTQNQALNALVFLYRDVLAFENLDLKNISWAKEKRNVPVVLTRDEVRKLIEQLKNNTAKWIIASLLYGTGMRLIECLRLRVKDLDFERLTITIHDGKGQKDRVVPLPASLIPFLKEQLIRSSKIWKKDLEEGFGRVSLPNALQRKYPKADIDWRWQFVFPSFNRSNDRKRSPTPVFP